MRVKRQTGIGLKESVWQTDIITEVWAEILSFGVPAVASLV